MCQSWNFSYQRELDHHNTVLEVRYNANHGTDLWRRLGLNEVNIFENGFLNEFQIAQNNLAIARGGNITNAISNNYGNQGLPGQKDIPILQTALGTTTDSTTATQLMLGQAGSTASAIPDQQYANGESDGQRLSRQLLRSRQPDRGGWQRLVLDPRWRERPYQPCRRFLLRRRGGRGVRRRLSSGVQLQASYTWAKALANGAATASSSSSDSSTPTTLRNRGIDKIPENFDIRNAIKLNGVYELPFGPGRRFNSSNPVARKIMEGWQIAGVARIQSGTPLFLNGLGTFNQTTSATGVILHNITSSQLQSMMGVYKTSLPGPNGRIIYYLPPPSTTSSRGPEQFPATLT